MNKCSVVQFSTNPFAYRIEIVYENVLYQLWKVNEGYRLDIFNLIDKLQTPDITIWEQFIGSVILRLPQALKLQEIWDIYEYPDIPPVIQEARSIARKRNG